MCDDLPLQCSVRLVNSIFGSSNISLTMVLVDSLVDPFASFALGSTGIIGAIATPSFDRHGPPPPSPPPPLPPPPSFVSFTSREQWHGGFVTVARYSRVRTVRVTPPDLRSEPPRTEVRTVLLPHAPSAPQSCCTRFASRSLQAYRSGCTGWYTNSLVTFVVVHHGAAHLQNFFFDVMFRQLQYCTSTEVGLVADFCRQERVRSTVRTKYGSTRVSFAGLTSQQGVVFFCKDKESIGIYRMR